jgi:hypothetical protein
MAASGGLITAANCSTPYMPRLETVNVSPVTDIRLLDPTGARDGGGHGPLLRRGGAIADHSDQDALAVIDEHLLEHTLVVGLHLHARPSPKSTERAVVLNL